MGVAPRAENDCESTLYLAREASATVEGKSRNLVEETWRVTCSELAACQDCRKSSLLHPAAKPLFGRFKPQPRGVLFVFEAPNRADTEDPEKGYLTYDCATDETGKFAHELLTEILGLSTEEFQVTNAVLCLPAAKETKEKVTYPVLDKQIQMCSKNIRHQIQALDPLVVVSVGRKALRALRHIERHPYQSKNLNEVVAQPVQWSGRWLFPVFHTSRLGRKPPYGRERDEQRNDWQKLRDFLVAKGVVFPAR